MIDQNKFTYSYLGKAFEKQKKSNCGSRKKTSWKLYKL